MSLFQFVSVVEFSCREQNAQSVLSRCDGFKMGSISTFFRGHPLPCGSWKSPAHLTVPSQPPVHEVNRYGALWNRPVRPRGLSSSFFKCTLQSKWVTLLRCTPKLENPHGCQCPLECLPAPTSSRIAEFLIWPWILFKVCKDCPFSVLGDE